MTARRVEVTGSDSVFHNFEQDGNLIGTYRGAETANTKFGERLIHAFEIEGGEIVKLWGKGILNTRLEQVEKGALVEVEFTGEKVKVKNGNAWVYKVYLLEEE